MKLIHKNDERSKYPEESPIQLRKEKFTKDKINRVLKDI